MALPGALNAALTAKSQLLVDELARNVQDDKLSGQVLADKTGRLKNSIGSAVEEGADGPTASVFVADDVPYAAIQEYGGQTKAHVIEATQGKALTFNWAGKQSFFAHVNHPGSDIPQRSYLRSALEDMQDDIVGGMADALNEQVTG